jgi:hypothetical protein
MEPRHPLQYCRHFLRGLRSKPWWHSSDLPISQQLEASFPRIQEEFLNIVLSGRLKFHPQSLGGMRKQLANGRWQIFELFSCGAINERNAIDVPFTSSLIRSMVQTGAPPGGLAYFSILHPHVHVAAHCGPTNTRIRTHLGLCVPHGAGMRVGTEMRFWQEGKCLVFDDSWEHEVNNPSDSIRAVLLIDSWHPDLNQRQRLALVRKHRGLSEERRSEREGWQAPLDANAVLRPSDIARLCQQNDAVLSVIPKQRELAIKLTAAKLLHTGSPFLSLAAAVLTPVPDDQLRQLHSRAARLCNTKDFGAHLWSDLRALLNRPVGALLSDRELVHVIHFSSLFWRVHPRNISCMDQFLQSWLATQKRAFFVQLAALGNIRRMIQAMAALETNHNPAPFGAVAPLLVAASLESTARFQFAKTPPTRAHARNGNSAHRSVMPAQQNFPANHPAACNGSSSAAVDVAWMLGGDNTANDWELRYSLRSFWTHYLANSAPWIIGRLPKWLDPTKVRFVPWPDPYSKCKDANLLQKAVRLAMESQLSDPFILCSDDHLLLRPSTPADFRFWYLDEIGDDEEGLNRWQVRLVNTGRQLRRLGFSSLNFDCHIPYPLRKKWLKNVLRFNFAASPGMCLFSTILNCSKVRASRLDREPIRAWLGSRDMSAGIIDAKLSRNQFACLNELSLQNPRIVSRLEQRFPYAAPWERDAAHSPRRSYSLAAAQPAGMFGLQ